MSAQPERLEAIAVEEGPLPLPTLSVDGQAHRDRRLQAYLGQSIGRAVVVVLIAYATYRLTGTSAGRAIWLAALVTVVLLPFVQWASQAARTMPVAFGTVTVDAVGAAAGLVTLSAVDAWFPGIGLGVRVLALVALLAFACIALWDTYVRRLATARVRVLLAGSGPALATLAEDVERRSGGPGFRIVGAVGEGLPAQLRSGPWPTGSLAQMERIVAETHPEIVAIASMPGQVAIAERLYAIAGADFRIVEVPELYEIAFARLPVRQLTPSWFMNALHYYNRPYGRIVKRAFDVVMGLVALLVALPLLPLVVIVVKRTKGPLFYRQVRLGQFGRPFTMIKFRSMVVDAETGSARWAQERDPRIIPGGSLIRRSRLDEIPQLINVIRGEMSFVGPRPERPELVRRLESQVPYWNARSLMKPGITGWAQIQAGYTADEAGAETKLAYDLWYLRHRSLVLDVVICLKTVTTLVTGSGAR